VTASARSLPAFTSGTTVSAEAKKKSTCPPSSAAIAGLLPLKGTCVIFTPASLANFSASTWVELPMLPEA